MSPERPLFDEDFSTLQATQQELDRYGYFFHPVTKEHIEAGVTSPLLHRLHTQIHKRGFRKVAGHVLLSFSGYAEDEREIFAIPEIRSFYRTLDAQLPELPALQAYLPHLRYNGPGFHLMLLGTIEEAIAHPELSIYDVHVADASPILEDALRRIEQAGRKYHLSTPTTILLMAGFVAVLEDIAPERLAQLRRRLRQHTDG